MNYENKAVIDAYEILELNGDSVGAFGITRDSKRRLIGVSKKRQINELFEGYAISEKIAQDSVAEFSDEISPAGIFFSYNSQTGVWPVVRYRKMGGYRYSDVIGYVSIKIGNANAKYFSELGGAIGYAGLQGKQEIEEQIKNLGQLVGSVIDPARNSSASPID